MKLKDHWGSVTIVTIAVGGIALCVPKYLAASAHEDELRQSANLHSQAYECAEKAQNAPFGPITFDARTGGCSYTNLRSMDVADAAEDCFVNGGSSYLMEFDPITLECTLLEP